MEEKRKEKMEKNIYTHININVSACIQYYKRIADKMEGRKRKRERERKM